MSLTRHARHRVCFETRFIRFKILYKSIDNHVSMPGFIRSFRNCPSVVNFTPATGAMSVWCPLALESFSVSVTQFKDFLSHNSPRAPKMMRGSFHYCLNEKKKKISQSLRDCSLSATSSSWDESQQICDLQKQSRKFRTRMLALPCAQSWVPDWLMFFFLI